MFYPSAQSMRIGVRKQRQEARALDCGSQLALIVCLGSRQPGRRDLAVLADEIAQRIHVLVIDLLDLLDREAAEPLALEQRILLVLAARALALTFEFTSSCSECHLRLRLLFR